uniref:Uncharacterized protein n=2 Tax=Rhizophagus irregularis TaxID=588596 RepID=U9U5W6_RHIID
MVKGTRILGVYLHADGNNSTTIAKINKMVNYTSFLIRGTIPISHYIIDPKFLYSHIMSLRSKGIMFLDQVITPDSAYLLEEYNKIKESLQNKQGRIPRWYNFLKNHLTISSTNNHLNIELNKPIIQNPRVERLRPPPRDRKRFD